MSKYYEFGKDLHLDFVNYKEATDSVDSKKLWKTRIMLGIPKEYVNLIKKCYEESLCRVCYLQSILDPFEVNTTQNGGHTPTHII